MTREIRGGRCAPLKREQAWAEFQWRQLRQWEIDQGARAKVGLGQDCIAIVRVSLGHPRGNEQ